MQDLQKFWGLVVEVWDQGFLGVDIARIGIAILVFALFQRKIQKYLHSMCMVNLKPMPKRRS